VEKNWTLTHIEKDDLVKAKSISIQSAATANEFVPTTLKLVEVDAPPAFSKAISPDFLRNIRLKAIPVRIQKMSPDSEYNGYCMDKGFAEYDEVVLSERLVMAQWRQPREEKIRVVYIHECCHRLMPDQPHDGAFLALNLILIFRSGITGVPFWSHLKLYDIHEEKEDDLGAALSFAWAVATDLWKTEICAEQCAQIVLRRYTKWKKWKDDAPVRAKAEAIAKQKLVDKVEDLKFQRIGTLLIGCLFGMSVFAIIAWHLHRG
jgi:hypothetical protein